MDYRDKMRVGKLFLGGTEVTATAAEINAIAGGGLDATELGILDGATVTTAELNLLDGSLEANSVASVAPILDTAKELRTNANVGTAGTGVTAVEYGDGRVHTSVLTVAATVPNIPGGADLGVGNLIYTFPAGAVVVDSAYMSLAVTQADGNITADTPEIGLGTVIVSGVVAVLSGTATFEDIITGQVAADCNGTATVKTAIPTAGTSLVIEAAAAHTVHANLADGWAASGDTGAALAGTVVLNWRFMA